MGFLDFNFFLVYPHAGSTVGLHDLRMQHLVWTNTLSLVHDSPNVLFFPSGWASPCFSLQFLSYSCSQCSWHAVCFRFFFLENIIIFCTNSSAGRFLTSFPLFDHAVAVKKSPRRLLCVGRDRSHQEANQVTGIVSFILHCWQKSDPWKHNSGAQIESILQR